MSEIACADTNVFVRALTRDDPKQTKAALNLFKRTQTGDLIIVINDVILTELIWVLSIKMFQLSHSDIRRLIEGLINTDGIRVRPANLSKDILEALKLFVDHNIDYTDAYIGSWMKKNGIDIIYTFNKRHFNRIEGIEVRVPQ
jgi:predicted nucleic acid-binding protein